MLPSAHNINAPRELAKANRSIPPSRMILECIGAQCGRQEAWTTVDLALIRGSGPHDQGSSWGFLCLADVHRLEACSNPDRGFPYLPILPSALGAEACSRYPRITSL